MADEYRVIGPPGTGKTTWIQKEVSARVDDGYMPSDFVLTSFTRAAAEVLRGAVDIPSTNATTLHAIAYRAMGSPPIAETGKLKKLWNEENIPESWKLEETKNDDFESNMPMPTAESMFDIYNMVRALQLPDYHPDAEKCKGFAQRWEDFKLDTGSVDFADMIHHAVYSIDECPGNPSILIVDEAQDLVPLQWEVVRKWAAVPALDRFIVVGDPAQVLYGFAGASVEDFMIDLPPENIRQLSKTYRMKSAVKDYAEGLLSQHSGPLGQGRSYESDPGGQIVRSEANWKYPYPILTSLNKHLAEGKRVMILTTSAYMLDPTIGMLRESGIPFWNPYRTRAGNWNPLGASSQRQGKDTTRTLDKVQYYLRNEQSRFRGLTIDEFHHLCSLFQAKDVFSKRGARAAVLRGDLAVEADDQERYHLFTRYKEEPIFTNEAINAMMAGDLTWLLQHCQKPFQRVIAYTKEIAARRGVDSLYRAPQTIIGTIHSVKGGEADVAYVFPDFSQAAWTEMNKSQEGMDAAVRVMYVAASRAKTEIVVCSPQQYNDGQRTLEKI